MHKQRVHEAGSVARCVYKRVRESVLHTQRLLNPSRGSHSKTLVCRPALACLHIMRLSFEGAATTVGRLLLETCMDLIGVSRYTALDINVVCENVETRLRGTLQKEDVA